MIIQCKKCFTKFRFEDALLKEDGVWVRCGQCDNEFFQRHPTASPNPQPVYIPPVKNVASVAEDVTVESKTYLSKEWLDAGAESTAKIAEAKPDEWKGPVEKKPSVLFKGLTIGSFLLTVVLLIVAVVFMFFPELGEQVTKGWSVASSGSKKVQPQRPSIPGGIEITGVKQHYVTNLFVGNLRIVEGMAVNQSGNALTRLKMKAEATDRMNNVVGERRTYAGNALSDAELATLTEEEINRKMNNPQGTAGINDRIVPNGQIPFMIIWASEPPGVAKIFVSVAGAERLLQ
jgi:predicted Zn finger-like uncharacterized protein